MIELVLFISVLISINSSNYTSSISKFDQRVHFSNSHSPQAFSPWLYTTDRQFHLSSINISSSPEWRNEMLQQLLTNSFMKGNLWINRPLLLSSRTFHSVSSSLLIPSALAAVISLESKELRNGRAFWIVKKSITSNPKLSWTPYKWTFWSTLCFPTSHAFKKDHPFKKSNGTTIELRPIQLQIVSKSSLRGQSFLPIWSRTIKIVHQDGIRIPPFWISHVTVYDVIFYTK
jgi:hypothetical protein